MRKFGVGDLFRPRGRVISAEDSEIGFDFLVHTFGFSIRLGVVGGGEGEVVVQDLAEGFGKGGGELRTTIRDDFVIESEAEEDFVENKSATPSVVMDFLVGHRITPLVRLWSTMTNKESKPAERGRLVIRLQKICWKGCEAREWMGESGGMLG